MNEIECETCVKRKTMYCPNHVDCYDTISKPYYQNRIMLLEENNQLKEQLQQQEEEYDRMFALWHSRKLIKKFDDEFDEEDKKKNPNRDYACICPDAEEVYKRYYELKEQLKQKEDIINKAKEKNKQIIKDTKSFYRPTSDRIYSGDCLIELATENIEILDNKGEQK